MPLHQLTLSWVLGQVSLSMRFLRAISELAVALWVLWTQALLVFNARCFGGIPQVKDLKVGMPDVGFKPSPPPREASGFQFLSSCGSLHQGWHLS